MIPEMPTDELTLDRLRAALAPGKWSSPGAWELHRTLVRYAPEEMARAARLRARERDADHRARDWRADSDHMAAGLVERDAAALCRLVDAALFAAAEKSHAGK